MPDNKLRSYGQYLDEYSDSVLTVALDYNGSGNLIFMGRTEAGNAKSTSFWQIKKLTYDGVNLTDIQWADGDGNFVKVWDDRLTYDYK